MGRSGLAGAGAVVLLAPLVVMAPAASADSGSFSNLQSISIEDRNFNKANSNVVNIPAAAGKATPYETNTVTIQGVQGRILDLDLELVLNHQYPSGVDVLLVGPPPESRRAVVLSDVGADQSGPVTVDLTLDDEADFPLPTTSATLTSGDYRPMNSGAGDVFASPAPDTSTAGSPLSVFDGMDPNGMWTLYVMGDGSPAGGNLNKWALDFDTDNKAKPYPSTIRVSGMSKGVTDVNVTLHGVTHPRPADVDIMLWAPGNQRAILMSNVGAATGGPAYGLTMRFDDVGSVLPKTLVAQQALGSGTFKPADYGFVDDDFPPPAPDRQGSMASMAVFNGANPNGDWHLLVLDTAFGEEGSIAGGWSLEITTAAAPAAPAIAAPANGSLDNDGVLDFTGTASPGSTVRLLDSGSLVGMASATSSGSWSAFVGGADDGWHSYTATATDSFGNVSAPSAPVSVLVDKVAPDGVVTIDGGAGRTSRTAVSLGLGATDPAPSSGIAQMRFSNNAATWSTFEPYAPTKAWTLPGGDGTKTVYAQFRDHAGNVSGTASDTIVLDTDGSGGGSGGSGSGGSGSGTSADKTAPTVTSTKPAHRATGVKPKANVTAVFSEAVQAASVNRDTVRLIAPDGRTVKAKVTYDPSRRTAVINPKTSLARGTTYKAVITAVRDVAGNQLDQKPKAGIQPKRWKFTTS